MSVFSSLKSRIEQEAVEHERLLTGLLVLVALVLLGVAIWGTPHHKAMACIYVVL